MRCFLCQNEKVTALAHVQISAKDPLKDRHYLQCQQCNLIFLHPTQRLSLEAEKIRYERHNNDPADVRYEAFLRRLWDPLRARLSLGAKGLDFGCGPTQAFSEIAAHEGFAVTSYDPFFFPSEESLNKTYDFIFCSESAEHFYEPGLEFKRLSQALRVGGVLGLMTGRLDDWSQFASWGYIHDPSHVCFYPHETVQWIGRNHGFEVDWVSSSVHLLTKIKES